MTADREKRGRPIARALAVMLAAVLLIGVTAVAIDLTAPGTLNISVSPEYSADAAASGAVFDLYKIADATGTGYTYAALPLYAGLDLSDPMGTGTFDVAQSAAGIALSGADAPVVSGGALGTNITKKDDGGNISAGLYLILVRGAALETEVTATGAGTPALFTKLRSANYEYSFAPRLVALPESGGTMTARLTMAPKRVVRLGVLEIEKTLVTYKPPEKATFVFEIVGYSGVGGPQVYRAVRAMSFTSAGTSTLRITDIPSGAYVTVTEIYSGSHYKLLSPATKTGTVSSAAPLKVTFRNDYNSLAVGGHGIINRFTYSDDDGWAWEQITTAE